MRSLIRLAGRAKSEGLHGGLSGDDFIALAGGETRLVGLAAACRGRMATGRRLAARFVVTPPMAIRSSAPATTRQVARTAVMSIPRRAGVRVMREITEIIVILTPVQGASTAVCNGFV